MVAMLLPLWAIGWDYNYRHYNPAQDGYQKYAQLNEVFWQTLTLMSYSEWHLNLVEAKQALDGPLIHRPPPGVGQERCTVIVPGPSSCTDVGAVTDPRALLFYQVFGACGAGGDLEGP